MRCFCAHVKGRRKISLVLSLLIGFILIAGAALAVPVPVLALSAGGIKGTIASIILSLLLQTGVAPTNTQWLNQLNTAYGAASTIGTIEDCMSNGLLTQTASGLVDTGLSNAIASTPEYTSLGLDTMFETTVSDVGVSAASGAVNIANTAINVGTLGTIGAFAGAATVGVGVGVLINHVREKLSNYIKYGLPLTANEFLSQELIYANGGLYYIITPNTSTGNVQTVKVNSDHSLISGYYPNGSWTTYKLTSNVNGVVNYRIEYYDNATGHLQAYDRTIKKGDYMQISDYSPVDTNYQRFNTVNDYNTYVNNVKNGTAQVYNTYSPDLIGPYGNQYAVEDTNNPGTYNYPGISNQIPNGYDMSPVDMDDYNDYVVSANQNTEDGLTGENNQGSGFTEFVTPYIVPEAIPDPEPDEPLIPEYPDEIPEYPDRPVIPDQPVIPDKPEIPAEDIETNLDLTATPDLRGIFPFCIPWDIYNLVLIFDTGENRQAPHITFTFPGTDWEIDVDLAEFDPVAGLLRLLELILFIVGLMVATRSLIGAGG